MRPVLLALCCLLSALVQARAPLRICYDDWAPYAAFSSGEGHHGLTIDLLRDVFGPMQQPLRFQSATQNRCLAGVKAGQVDIMLFGDQPLLPHWLRTHTPTEFWLVGAWVREDSPLTRFENLNQFKGQRVGMVRGYVYPPPISTYHDWVASPLGDAIEGLLQLNARRLDVYFEDVLWVRRELQEKHFKLRLLQPLVAAQPQFHLFRPELADLMAAYEKAVEQRIRDGDLDRRYRSTLGVSYDAVRRGDYAAALTAQP